MGVVDDYGAHDPDEAYLVVGPILYTPGGAVLLEEIAVFPRFHGPDVEVTTRSGTPVLIGRPSLAVLRRIHKAWCDQCVARRGTP